MQTQRPDPRSFIDDDCLGEYERSVFIISRARILRFLFSVDEANILTILENANVSFNMLAAVYASVAPLHIMERTYSGLKLNGTGRAWVIANRKKIFMQPVKVKYSAPPEFTYAVEEEVRVLPKKYRL